MTDILKNLNRKIDHAALHSEVNEQSVLALCREARDYQFYAVAVNPVWTQSATRELAGSRTKVVTVTGFPLGANRTETKLAEALNGVNDGANEIDMVANIGWLVSGEYGKAEQEISTLRKGLPFSIVLKVIIEAAKLSTEQQIMATRAVINGGAQFVKTGTGFFGGTTTDQVKTLFRTSEEKIKIKASGEIRTLSDCENLLKAGAERLGSSSSVAIMRELAARSTA